MLKLNTIYIDDLQGHQYISCSISTCVPIHDRKIPMLTAFAINYDAIKYCHTDTE